jgi:hypothetical protein
MAYISGVSVSDVIRPRDVLEILITLRQGSGLGLCCANYGRC